MRWDVPGWYGKDDTDADAEDKDRRMQMADDEARGMRVLPGWRTRVVTRQEKVERCVATAIHNQSSWQRRQEDEESPQGQD